MDSQQTAHSSESSRSLPLAGAIVIGFALVGFLLGIGEPEAPVRANESQSDKSASPSKDSPPLAVAYGELSRANLKPNGDWTSALKDLRFDRPSLFDAVHRAPEMKAASLVDRSRTRAFEGAPPVIPHRVEQQSAASCLACHGEGAKLGDRIATKISHAHFTSCTQCHVEGQSGAPFDGAAPIVNEFQGLARCGPGERAYAGAPPTIPHSSLLRNDCMSCHGLIARPGLRTTHPWLSNCEQCHAPSARLDQVPFARNEQ